MGKTLGVTFEVGAKTMGTVASTFATVESRIKNLKSSAKELQTFQTKAAALTTATARLQDKKAAYAANPTAALKKELDAAQRAFNSAEKSAAKYNITVANSAKVQAQTTAAIKKTEAALARQEKLQANQAKRRELHGRIVGTVATAATVAAPVKLAMDYETAMADVKKVTNFDAPGFAAFSRDMLKLSTEIPMTADGLAQIAAAAGQAGIAEEELLRFTKDAAIMAVAFDITAAEAGSAMTGLRTNFKLGQDGVISLGDSFNHLANNMDATAGEIINFATRAGRVGTLYNFSGEQMGALGAAFIAMKMPAEVASRATNSLFMKLGMADQSTKEAQAAFKRLGLPAKQMAKMFKEDSQGALLTFLEAVKKSKDPMKELRAILGEGFADEVAGLVGGLDEYKKALGLIGDQADYAGSMQEEYNVRAKTTANSLELMKNAGKRLGVILGTTLLPALATVADKTVQLLEPVATLAAQYPQVTTVVFAAGAAFAGLMVVTLATAYAATILSDGYTVFKGVISHIPTKTALVTKAQWLLNAALTANPIGIVVVAVAALAAGLYWLYQNSETARAAMDKIWATMKTVGQSVLPVLAFPLVMAWTLVSTAIQAVSDFVCKHWDTISAAAAFCFQTIANMVSPLVTVFGTVWGVISEGAIALFDGIGKAIDAVASKFKTVAEAWAKVKGWFGDDDATVSVVAANEPPKPPAGGRSPYGNFTPASMRGGPVAPLPAPVVAAVSPVDSPAGKSDFSVPAVVPPIVVDVKAPLPVTFDKSDLLYFGSNTSEMPNIASLSDLMAAMPAAPKAPPVTQVEAPVTQNINVTMHGIPDKEFAERVISAVKANSGALESIISKIVSNIMARQKRLSYES